MEADTSGGKSRRTLTHLRQHESRGYLAAEEEVLGDAELGAWDSSRPSSPRPLVAGASPEAKSPCLSSPDVAAAAARLMASGACSFDDHLSSPEAVPAPRRRLKKKKSTASLRSAAQLISTPGLYRVASVDKTGHMCLGLQLELPKLAEPAPTHAPLFTAGHRGAPSPRRTLSTTPTTRLLAHTLVVSRCGAQSAR